MAMTGTPYCDLRENRRSTGMSSPIVMVTRGPIHVMALMDDINPRLINAPTIRPPCGPNTCLPAIDATSRRRRLRRDGFEIAAKCHGGERNGRCKADRRRQPTGHKPERRMIDPAQKVVLPARSRQHGGQFGVAECPTDRHDSADDPQQEEREAGPYVGD